MRSSHLQIFLQEEAPSGVLVGRTPSSPLYWAHEGKTECGILFGLAKGWLGHLVGVLAQATPINTAKRCIMIRQFTLYWLVTCVSHPCLKIEQEHTTEPACSCPTSIKDGTVVVNHHHVHSTDRWWAVGHFVSRPATWEARREE